MAVGGGRERSLLALLLICAGEVVSRDRLIEELGRVGLPRARRRSLDAYVSRLRRAFRRGRARATSSSPGHRLRTHGGGYGRARLRVARRRRPRHALGGQRCPRGVELLRAALALWRGSPYAEIAGEPWARAECGRLEELRLAATEDRIEAELALGYHAALVGGARGPGGPASGA